ncbi:hypothetical protein HMPREF9719_00142 [Corynebacterium otitidis ATCC 51513]|uniref:ABC3 transporter permease C-terminal domain-containing protein n=2 Tax=Corynebacterium otitidis TaxID=29321 RepID=K0Z6E4_9CORY|nr:ABC transporter permease [Corynebacterium otitidis]EJZ82960.1 hypothetical protein HMPREF9719_00142 [Corynebacterium otitidis ATCC 51513]
MYLAVRDIRAAAGRFGLVSGVVALITLLIVMLTGLTAGLGKQNTSALEALGPDRFVFGAPGASNEAEVSFTDSVVSPEAQSEWDSLPGVEVTELGVAQTRLEVPVGEPGAGATEPLAVMGLPAGTPLPGGGEVPGDGVLLPDELLEGDAPGAVLLGGTELPVAGEAATEWYSHQPVAWVPIDRWYDIAHAERPTVLLASGEGAQDAADNPPAGTVAASTSEALMGLPAYASERGSLLSIQALLYGISALVVLAFLSVWTIQRTRDLAVLRALGASKGYVLRDALAQAGIVLAAGAGVGSAAGAGLGALAATAVPFELTAATVIVPALGVAALGAVGAFVATRRVVSIDPNEALGAAA